MTDARALEGTSRVRLRFFAVSKYVDQIKVKFFLDKPESDYQYEYFEIEAVAKKFIIDRAYKDLANADKIVKLAERRVKKCEKKFAAP